MYCGVGLKARALCVECVEGEREGRGGERMEEEGERRSISLFLSLAQSVGIYQPNCGLSEVPNVIWP